MSEVAGYFIDWDTKLRSTDHPGKGHHCEIDRASRYVAVKDKYGSMIHEATFYPSLEAVAKAGIKSQLVDESGNPI
ncbi:MAG TPA: hypothetical protein DCO68_11970 [Methylophilaceae bacterium]|nr:hypothetical protein [Methylophilaceae bacterium]HAJ72782.1 hypothetical protein [Methylophilaceae bacterium]